MTDSSSARAHGFVGIDAIGVITLMDGVRVRQVNGERITLAVMELDALISLPDHRHPNQPGGPVLPRDFPFTPGVEQRLRNPGQPT